MCLRFWTIITGTAAICSLLEDGRRQIVGLETDGDTVCGLMSSADNPTWLEALEETVVCELDFSPDAASLIDNASFISAMFEVVHTRLETTTRQLASLGRLDSTERVVLFLAEMARRWEHRLGPQCVVALPMSREDIADYLGLNTETVSRVMSRVKKLGLFRFLSPTEYTVPDFGAIERRLPVSIPERHAKPFARLPSSEKMLKEFAT